MSPKIPRREYSSFALLQERTDLKKKRSSTFSISSVYIKVLELKPLHASLGVGCKTLYRVPYCSFWLQLILLFQQ